MATFIVITFFWVNVIEKKKATTTIVAITFF
jgi:hypothetical protein